MAEHFRGVFMQTGVALYRTCVLPPYSLLHSDHIKVRPGEDDGLIDETGSDWQERAGHFERFWAGYQAGGQSGVGFLKGAGGPATRFAPLDLASLAVDVVGPHCLN